jgi:AcrR family transcriptional regulator
LPDRVAEQLPAAAALFAARGVENTSVADIASATGIPRATLYYHFDDKQAVLAHLLARLLDRFAAEVTTAAAADADARSRLHAVVRAIVTVIAEEPDTCLVLLGDLSRAGRMPDIAAHIDRAFHRPLRRLLRDGAADHTLQVTDVEHTAAAVFGAVVFAALQQPSLGAPVEVDRVTATVTDLLDRGLAATTRVPGEGPEGGRSSP